MKVHSAYYSPLLIAILITINIGTPGIGPTDRLFEQGQEHLQNGDWKEALNTWLKAKTEIS
ncbi:MAG: hypothetical protein U5J63_13155 [Fodinibius sp.]|nr:hypothetical protein [Fodinibius sp.]